MVTISNALETDVNMLINYNQLNLCVVMACQLLFCSIFAVTVLLEYIIV